LNKSRSWYNFAYNDVRLSHIDPVLHYKKYGATEGRFKNIYHFVSLQRQFSFRFLNLFLSFLFYLICYLRIIFIKKMILKLFIRIECIKICKFNFEQILLTSWIGDGTNEAVELYAKKMSKESTIAILRGLKYFDGSQLQPMTIDIWQNSSLIQSINLVYPIHSLKHYDSKYEKIKKIHLHHMIDIENNVKFLLENFNSEIIYYLHDFNLFTENKHLEKRGEVYHSLSKSIELWPNAKIDLNYFINKISVFICPSNFVYTTCREIIPDKKLRIAYHPEREFLEQIPVNNILTKNSYNILIIGNMSINKGSQLLKSIIEESVNSELPFKFIHFGRNPIFDNFESYVNFSNLSRDQFKNKISDLNVDFAFLPFQTPETYSFSLSDVILDNLPLISFSSGAITERCAGRKNTILLSQESGVDKVINSFLRLIYGAKVMITVKPNKTDIFYQSRNANIYSFLK
jgi:hypothetical protein